jgi:hypothetical protein
MDACGGPQFCEHGSCVELVMEDCEACTIEAMEAAHREMAMMDLRRPWLWDQRTVWALPPVLRDAWFDSAAAAVTEYMRYVENRLADPADPAAAAEKLQASLGQLVDKYRRTLAALDVSRHSGRHMDAYLAGHARDVWASQTRQGGCQFCGALAGEQHSDYAHDAAMGDASP